VSATLATRARAAIRSSRVIGVAERKFWREFEHTGDAGIELEARSRGELFARGALALARLMVEPRGVRMLETRRVEAHANSDADLMHDLLAAALNLFLADAFIWRDARVLDERPELIVLELSGEKYDARRHHLLTEIKAVTYHELTVGHAGARWNARIVFDI
jgi:protein archease